MYETRLLFRKSTKSHKSSRTTRVDGPSLITRFWAKLREPSVSALQTIVGSLLRCCAPERCSRAAPTHPLVVAAGTHGMELPGHWCREGLSALFQDDQQARGWWAERPAEGGAVLVPPLPSAATSGPMGGDAVALPCPLKLQSGSCGGQWADGSCRPQAPGEGHWEADRKGAKGEMNTEPRNRCVWPTSSAGPLDHQRRPLHVAERMPGCQPCPGTPPPEPAVTQNLAKCSLLLIVSPPQPQSSDWGAERYCPLPQCWPGCGCGSPGN